MKYNCKHILAAITVILFGSCADNSLLDFQVAEPESSVELKYLNDYDVLKSYVDRTANPNFKLGAGVSVSEYTSKGVVYRLANSNFDEITAGYEMKHMAVVQPDGSLALDNVTNFLATAKAAGTSVFGHTLCWHANQNATYLNSLIAPLIVTPPAFANSLDLTGLKNSTFTGWDKSNSGAGISTVSGTGMASSTNVVQLISGSTSSAATDLKLITPSIPVVSGHKYEVVLYIKSDVPGEGRISFEGLSNNTPPMDWMSTGSKSATFKTAVSWKQVRCQVSDFTGSTFKVHLDLGYKPNVTYSVDINNFYVYDTQGSPSIVNLISNSDFEAGNINGWGGWGNSSTRTISAKGEGFGGTGYALKETNPSKTSGYWGVQFAYGLPSVLDNGAQYTLSFDVKGDNTGIIRPELQSPNYSSDGFGMINLTTSWKHYELTITCTAATRKTLIISCGEMAGSVYLDNVMLYKTSGASLTNLTVNKTAAEKTQIIGDALESWISGMLGATKDYVKAWDVVNEPMSDWPDQTQLKTGTGKTLEKDEFYWQDYLGKDYAVKAIGYARKYGNATDKLFINDYGLEGADQKKCLGLIEYIKYVESKGAKVDGIGTQMHVTLGETSMAGIRAMLTNLAATGKLIKISELDMGIKPAGSTASLKTADVTNEQLKQMSDFYKEIVKAYFELIPAAQRYGITQWACTDSPTSSSWRGGEPIGLWTLNYSRKHAYAGFADGLSAAKK